MLYFITLAVLVPNCIASVSSSSSRPTDTNTKRLIRRLFDENEYDNRIRPVFNETSPIHVEMLLYVKSILDMLKKVYVLDSFNALWDERRQILKTNSWLTFNWNDEFLQWNPEDFGGLTSFKIISQSVWTPDITLYNSAEAYARYMDDKVVVVYHTGAINWASPTVFVSHCRISVTLFPFDRQSCEMKFGPWQHDGTEVVVRGQGDESIYISDGEWDMQSVDVASKSQMYPDAPGIEYFDVTYTISITRRSNYYVFNLILPCVLISGITTLVFILPADSGEKVSLGITVLLSLTVFLLIIAESMPATSDVPVIGQYYAATMLLVSVSVVLTIIVLNLHHGGPYVHPVPRWMRYVILYRLARFLRLNPKATNPLKAGGRTIDIDSKPPGENNPKKKRPMRIPSTTDDPDMMEMPKLAYLECPDSPLLGIHANGSARGSHRKSHPSLEGQPSLSEETILLKRLLGHASYFRDRAERDDLTHTYLTEWKQIAVVVDRIFMIFYLVLSAATMLIIIAQVE